MFQKAAVLVSLVSLGGALASCGPKEPVTKKRNHDGLGPATAKPPTVLSIVGTNDLHGHIEMLPLLGGYLDILRSHPERAVLLIDGGDMFQGTLASNLKEGAPIVEAYNQLGYDAAAIGNHEFDYGPIGPDATVTKEGQDPRGALKARAASADFPFLASNIFDDETDAAVDWPNVQAAVMHEERGIKIGIIGVSTFETPNVTLPANFVGLSMAPLAARIAEHADALRGAGARIVIVAAHAGGECTDFSDPKDTSTCQPKEIMEVANELPAGSVDAIVAGHTHKAMAHEVNGIAIIESRYYGKAFGRIDFSVASDGTLALQKIFPPRSLCKEDHGPDCDPGEYEQVAVLPSESVIPVANEARAFAEEIRSEVLGVELPEGIARDQGAPSALGDLFTDLMLAAQPRADVAITNGGGLRDDLPAGPLTYGGLFQALPFDNRFALVRIQGGVLRRLFASNLVRDSGILSVAGLAVAAACKGGELQVTMKRPNGKKVRDSDVLVVATSDFVASGGDGLIGSEGLEAIEITLDQGPLMRDQMADVLRKRGGELRPSDFFNPEEPRIRFPGRRPVRCGE